VVNTIKQTKTPIRLGIVGVGGRGTSLASLVAALEPGLVAVSAVCDSDERALASASASFPDAAVYAAFDALLADEAADAVFICTPMPLHAPMSAAALEAGVHVLCEVPAAVNVDEARSLVHAATASDAIYAMAENYLFMTPNRMVRALARAGCFGTIYYGRGQYVHELKQMNEDTPWRRTWQTGVRGVTYPTHSIGPILDWTAGDRVVKVACAGTGSHHVDPRGEAYHDDSATMLCQLASGGLAEVRVDMVSDRPHAMSDYELQGTDGAYESARGTPDGRIWLRELDPEPRWRPLREAYEEVVARRAAEAPAGRHAPADSASGGPRAAVPARATLTALEPVPDGIGHGGGDYFVLRDFLEAIRDDREPQTDIHRALDMTLPGLMSRPAIEAGTWVGVPDSRAWLTEQSGGQLVMVWPPDRQAPTASVPDGYELGQLRYEEREAYVDLMHRAGFADWNIERFGWVDSAVLPDGHFVVRSARGQIVSTALAAHRPSADHPHGGELGWVATHPDHTGRGLGRVVCSAVIDRFRSAGYRRVYLLTNDFRHPAVALYLKLGFEPYIKDEAAPDLWAGTLRAIGWPDAVRGVMPDGSPITLRAAAE
jgi:predicted dehydrogenase/GNAT superfamily N-acetyltransferase